MEALFMKKVLLFIYLTVFLTSFQVIGRNPSLRFHQNGEFKILQLTDLHLHDSVEEIVLATVKEMVESEKPDLVVLTGDITFKYRDSTFTHIKNLARIFSDEQCPWAVVLGNHDEECGYTRSYISKVYRSLPYNRNAVTQGIRGVTNFVIPIAGKKSNHDAVLYFFDSNAYNSEKNKKLGKFDWIDFTQLDWYRKTSAAMTKKNDGKPIPSIAFFHIPLLEYEMVWADSTSTSIGVKNDKASTPLYNTGLFASMLQCGDIMGTFVGHDHINNYIGCYNGIALAYGQYTGPINYGVLKPGARVIVLKEGKREFTTWIREKGGKIKYMCHYPNSFLQDAE